MEKEHNQEQNKFARGVSSSLMSFFLGKSNDQKYHTDFRQHIHSFNFIKIKYAIIFLFVFVGLSMLFNHLNVWSEKYVAFFYRADFSLLFLLIIFTFFYFFDRNTDSNKKKRLLNAFFFLTIALYCSYITHFEIIEAKLPVTLVICMISLSAFFFINGGYLIFLILASFFFILYLSLNDNVNTEKLPENNVYLFFIYFLSLVIAYIQYSSERSRYLAIKKLNDMNENLDTLVKEKTKKVHQNNTKLLNEIESRKQTESILRKNNELLQILSDYSSDVIWILSDALKFVFISNNVFKILGYKPEDFKRLTWQDFLTKESNEKLQEILTVYMDKLKKGKAEANVSQVLVELEHKTQNENTVWMEILASPKWSHEDFDGIIGVSRNIEERKRHEKIHQELLISEQSASFKQNFLANMNHEIKTPLGGIIGISEVIIQNPDNIKNLEYIKIINESSIGLLHMINDILDVSKIEKGAEELEVNHFNMTNLIEHLNKVYNVNAVSKSIQLSIEYDKDADWNFLGDSGRILQAMRNLVSNAIKFTEKGYVKIILSQVSNNKNTATVKFEVIDTGIGISSDDQKKIFELFAQLENTIRKKFDGTGLGLYMTKKIISLMNGELRLISKVGEGSSFWFVVDLKRSHIIDSKEELTPVSTIKENQLQNKKYCILIVDDKKVNRKIIELMLMSRNYQIDHAENGKQALDMIKDNSYDFVFMDIMMPVMDGMSAICEIRKLHKRIPPIIAISAYARQSKKNEFIEAGFDDYIEKPVLSEHLFNKIDTFLLKKK